MKDHKDFFGLAPGKLVGLKYAGVVKCLEVRADSEGVITEVLAEFVKEGAARPKTYLNWIAAKESQDCEVRLYSNLFTEDPNESKRDFLELINTMSLVVKRNSKMSKAILPHLAHLSRYQFERQGFFAVDFDSNIAANRIVWNKIVGLSDTGKQKALQRVVADAC